MTSVMTWRPVLALILVAAFSLTSQAMAVARGHAAAPGTITVICAGDAVVTVTLDAQGDPSPPMPACSDCLACAATLLSGTTALPLLPDPMILERQVAFTSGVRTAHWPVPLARAPPPLQG